MFTRDKEFYKSFVSLSLVLMAEQAVILTVNLADNLMLGSYSEAALSGAAAVNQIQFVLQQIVYAVSNGVIVIGSQYWGKNDPEKLKQLLPVGAAVSICITAAFFLAVSLFPSGALTVFTNDPEIQSQGMEYLNIIRFSYIFFGLTTVMLGIMRVVETVRIALQVSVIALFINVSINYLLIEGRWGLPELGVRGAAIGTLTARLAEFCIVSYYLFFRERTLSIKFTDLFQLHADLLSDYIKISAPIIIASITWGVSNAVQSVILGHMNSKAIAAYSISTTLFLLFKVTSVGASSAASVIIGRTIGKGDMKLVREYSRTLQLLFIAIGAVLAVMYATVCFPMLSVYSISPETKDMASSFMIIQTMVLFTMSYQMPVNSGIIRGGGDTRFLMIVDLISQLLMFPLAAAGAFILGWMPVCIVLIVNSDQIFKCLPAFIRVNSYKWIKQIA